VAARQDQHMIGGGHHDQVRDAERSDGPTVAALGVADLIVVATADHVLILPRGHSQEGKRQLEAVKAKTG
jgi:mannose-1-phosphate guanylyltransferase/mannose-1-phosphate guanylyltransferase/mannose-6-phosphate isomerase